jgi:membrane protein implicated in regulation of membrane protease activity
MEYWHWLVFGMLLIGVEIFLPSFTSLWFGLGALLVGTLMLLMPGMALSTQIMIWAVASAAATFVWFRYFRRRSPDRTKAGIAREAILGESGQVISVPTAARRGVMRFTMPVLGADEWEFICEDPVAVGDRVVVVDLSGNTLIVSKR